MSNPSFSVVQFETAIGPYTSSPEVSFASKVQYGSIIAVFFGAYRNGSPFTYPTSVTDSAGNAYTQVSQSNSAAGNRSDGTFLWIATDVIGGTPLAITINGFAAGGGTGVGRGPSLIIVEIEGPAFYQTCSVGLSQPLKGLYNSMDQGGTASVFGSTLSFRFMANNGSPGGANCSDTTVVSLELLPAAVNPATRQNAMVGVALINQFLDVWLLMGNYNNYGPTSPYFTTTGTLVATTYEPTGGGSSNPGCSLGVAFGDFPYMNGPLLADCDNPPNGTVGTPYSHGIVADGGTPPYTYTIIGGMLPPGLTLNSSTGVISGTPTQPGKFQFSVQIVDSGLVSIVIDCLIAICPAAGAGGPTNYGWTG